MANNAEKEIESFLKDIFKLLFDLIKAIFKGIYYGIKKLNSKIHIIIFLLTFLVSISAYFFKPQFASIKAPVYIQYSIFYTFFLFPVLYLFLLGNIQNKKQDLYKKIFIDIGFKGRDGNYPICCGVHTSGKKTMLVFQSMIPLNEWKSARERLETGLDCNILKIECGDNKKIVKITAVPTSCKIPLKIDWNDSYLQKGNGMITVGQGALDQVVFDLNRTPHVLIAGETGSGKSVILRECLWQLINQGSKVYMIDFKGGVEFGKQYECYGEVITDRKRALEVLTMLVNENSYRLQIFRDLEVKNLPEYNKKTGQHLCRIGVVCDEIAEMLDKKGVSREDKEIFEQLEGKISSLARLSRATGINLLLGVQRPDANVLTGQIKNNIPVRISGRFADKVASEIVLGNTDAVDLPDIKGRFLYKVGNETIEFQSYYFDDDTMLKDIDVEIGDMLTEAPKYHQHQNNQPKSQEALKKAPAKTKFGNKKTDTIDSEKLEAELRAMDEYDLNLDFFDYKSEEE